MKKIIDGDRMVQIGSFNTSDEEKQVEYYKTIYGSVSTDMDGDIICFKESEEDL